MTSATSNPIHLPGLDGSNLLAFLAALGTLRTLHRENPQVQMSWRMNPGTGVWKPVLWGESTIVTGLGEKLHRALGVTEASGGTKKGLKMAKQQERRAKKVYQTASKELKAFETRERERAAILKKALGTTSGQGALTAKAIKERRSEIDKQVRHAIVLKQCDLRLDDLKEDWLRVVSENSPFPHFALGDDFRVTPSLYRQNVSEAIMGIGNTHPLNQQVEFCAAYATEAVIDKDGVVCDTELRAVGGGQTRILKEIRRIVGEVTAEQIAKSLFLHWDYADPSPTLRWDPNENRPYALQANDPAPDQEHVTMRGANRLAIEAMPLLPVFAVDRKAHTTGFRRAKGEDWQISWPIWEGQLGLDEVRTLLSISELQDDNPSAAWACHRGIAQIYRASRVTDGQYRTFTPATSLL